MVDDFSQLPTPDSRLSVPHSPRPTPDAYKCAQLPTPDAYKNSQRPTPDAQRILQLTFAALILLFTVSISIAGEITVEVAAVATSVENLIPIGVSDKFPSSVGRLYCYSKIIGGEGQNIRHLWYINEKKFGETTLPIKAGSYRTYSLVNILPGTKGSGRVEITTDEGKVLKSIDFYIE